MTGKISMANKIRLRPKPKYQTEMAPMEDRKWEVILEIKTTNMI